MDLFEKKILLVDDHRELLEMTKGILAKYGYTHIVTARDYKSGLRAFQEEQPDLAILDVMLPDGNGFELFQEIRKSSSLPILFLSARDEDADRIMGLGLGADDYITKPFLPQELVLRVGAILRRSFGPPPDSADARLKYQFGKRRVSAEKAMVEWEGGNAPLTATELAILEKLIANRGNIVTFDRLCQAVWQDDYYGYENTLMVHVRHIRQKLEEDPSHPRWLLTIRGVGYRLNKEEEKP